MGFSINHTFGKYKIMATVNELQKELNKIKKEVREFRTHNKFLLDRLDLAHEKNAILREEKRNITVDDVVAFQKSKADYASTQNQSFVDQLEKQEQIKLDPVGVK